jgi:HK97 family phage prohead protease
MPKNEKPKAGQREVRFYEFEIRAVADKPSNKRSLVGKPIVYNQTTDIGGYFREVIEPGAVDALTELKDVPLLVGHDMRMIPLARSRNNNANSTMQLIPVDDGMDMRADVDTENNATAKALYSACERGDITGMSFAFLADKERWEDLDKDYPTRHIEHFKRIVEVSAVSFPAYDGASILTGRDDESALESARFTLESARNALKEERDRQHNEERREEALKILRR